MSALSIVTTKGEPRVDTRLLAGQLGVQHPHLFEMVKDYGADFQQLGILRFETGKIIGRGRPERYALLNEDQCYLLLTFSRNTAKVRALKVKLVLAFKQARAGQEVAALEYLPGYHELHDRAHELASGSPNERFVHMNLNKLVNKAVGIRAGQRGKLAAPVRSLTVVAQTLATKAMAGAKDHHDGYQSAKRALLALEQLLIGKAA